MFSIQDSQIETRLFVIGIPIRAIVPSPAMGFREQALKMMHKTRKSKSSLVQCRALAVVMEEGVLKRKSQPWSHLAHVQAAIALVTVAKMPVPGSDVGGPRLQLLSAKSSHVALNPTPTPMRPEEQPEAPSGPWRAASAFTMGAVGLLCKGFLNGLSKVETHGMEGFLKLLDEREDPASRQRGLITGKWLDCQGPRACSILTSVQSRTTSPCTYVCHNLLTVMDGLRSHNLYRMDDPILWGILPLAYIFTPDNLRWGLGSYDLCFTNKYVTSGMHRKLG